MESSATMDADRRRAAWRLVGPGIVLASTLAAIAWVWHRCPDPVVDFGRELHVPWRIADGQVLYRDLNYFNGPFSPYFNAMLFESLGASLRTLKLGNALIILVVAMLLYRLLREIGDRVTATAAGVLFAGIFACGQLTQHASFNWLTPYAHDLTHGIALSLAMVACIWRYQATCRTRWLMAAGLMLGLVSLTKAEVLLAALVAAGGGLGTIALLSRPSGRDAGRAIALFIAPAILPPLLATALLWLAMPLGEALAGVAGAWRWFGDPRLLRISYFRWLMGIDDPVNNFINLFVWTGWYGAVLLPGLLLAMILRARPRRIVIATSVLLAVAVAVVLGWKALDLPWAQAGRALPVILLAILAATALQIPLKPTGAASSRLVLTITFTLFALALLLRTILRVNLHHYGFAFAMPAMLAALVALASWAPRWAAGAAPSLWIPRAAVLSAAGVLLAMMLFTSHQHMSRRTHPVGEGADRFLADARGLILEQARLVLLRESRPGQTVVTIPESQMLSYLTRRPSPTRYQNFLPAEMMMFQESRMLADLQARPPDWIALVHADTSIYDAPFFGQHYGARIQEWISGNYVPVEMLGARPFQSREFGILIMRRSENGAATGE